MKSIKQQYIDLKEGKMSQHNFMRSVRMSLPQYITNVTSFNDTVKILKNKGILNEAVSGDPIESALKSYLAKGYSYSEAIRAVAAEEGIDEETLSFQYPQDMVDIEGYEADDEDAEFDAMIARAEDELSPEKYKFDDFEGGLNEAKKKKEPKAELHPNQIHPQELRMGIKVELEHTDDLDKAKKIALDHLAENPFYYTALKLAGVESPSAPKAKPVEEKKPRKKKEAVELVDKDNQMQKVKMPKVEESYKSWLSQKQGEEAEAKKMKNATNASGVEFSVNDTAVTPDGKEIEITGFMVGDDGKMKALYSAGMFADVYNLDDLTKKSSKPTFRPGVNLGKYDLKSLLEELVREVLSEMQSNDQEIDNMAMDIDETFDGRDNLDAENEY